MAGNTFGNYFRVTTFGESHGGAVGVVMDGVPPRLKLDLDDIQGALDRRRPGQGDFVSQRNETDRLECLAGLQSGLTLGTPLCFIVRNKDFRPDDYASIRNVYRPSHADFVTEAKYGIAAESGGGRSSARETIGRVIAGATARQILRRAFPNLEVLAWVDSIHEVTADVDPLTVIREAIESSQVRCPDRNAAAAMMATIAKFRDDGDSVGGNLRCVVRGLPAGFGDPVFDKLDARLAGALMSLPATKGVEIGSGFAAATMTGSQHNDPFLAPGSGGGVDPAELGTKGPTESNHSGGIQGGISNGAPILIRLAFKPVSSIKKPQVTITKDKRPTVLTGVPGRHDPCVLPRAVPMVEAMVWLVLVDNWMANNALQLPLGRV